MAKVLFVTKDPASAWAIRLAFLLKALQHEVAVIAEGLSVDLWKRARFDLYFQGFVDYRLEPFSIGVSGAKDVLRRTQPQLVITCEGQPIHLEQSFGIAANACNIPLTFLEDFWNGFKRDESRPDCILTIDAYAAELARHEYPKTFVASVGSNDALPYIPSELEEQIKMLRATHGKVAAFVGGETTSDLTLMLACMRITGGCLVPCLHAKHKIAPVHDGRTKEEVWRELIEEQADVISVWWPEGYTASQIAPFADVVCSGLSTDLRTAARAKKPAAVLWTPEVRALQERVVGLEVSPFYKLGIAELVETPTDLSTIRPPSDHILSQFPLFDPRIAYDALREAWFL